MENKVILPNGFLLIVDDVGWWLSGDERYYVKVPDSARAMMRRRYCLEDYRSLVEIGRGLGMRVLCGFTIGEWDRDRLLAEVPNSNMYGAKWDNAVVLRHPERLDEVRDYINANRDYIEMAIHGLNHMYWDDATGECIFAEYYRTVNGKRIMLEPSVMRQHLDAWFEIYRRSGFTAPVDKLIPPCFQYNYSRGTGEMSHILKEYGIRYVSTPFSSLGYDTPDKPVDACIENGILTTDRTGDYTPWYEMDAAVPDKPLKSSPYGTHWPHFIAGDPADNPKTVQRWIEYFRRYREHFGVIAARDHQMAANQCFYRRFTRVNESEDRLLLDFTQADAQGAPADVVGDVVYLNVKKPYRLSCPDDSCQITLYDRAAAFSTYRLVRHRRWAELDITAAE